MNRSFSRRFTSAVAAPALAAGMIVGGGAVAAPSASAAATPTCTWAAPASGRTTNVDPVALQVVMNPVEPAYLQPEATTPAASYPTSLSHLTAP